MAPEPVHVGLLVAPMSRGDGDADRLRSFCSRVAEDVRPQVEAATERAWRFDHVRATTASGEGPHRPSDFLDEAALRMVSGPYDMVIVVTDAQLSSRRERLVSGLASRIAHVVVVSTWHLTISPRGRDRRPLDSAEVRWNAAALMLHLLGHMLGARRHRRCEGVMAPWHFDEALREVPRFDERSRRRIRSQAARFPERSAEVGNPLQLVWFHVLSVLRNPRQALRPLLRSRALFLALSLPRLATAAVVPSLVIIASAESWDIGVNMSDTAAFGGATVAVLAASAYVTFGSGLFFPPKDRRLITEHMAIVNTSILTTTTVAMVGLLMMLGALLFAIETLLFPEGLIHTWPTLSGTEVGVWDEARLALFVASLGTVSGALAGVLEQRDVLRHLALFHAEV